MTAWLDIDAVKVRVPIMDVISLLGFKMETDGDKFRGPCPYCEDKRSFQVTPYPTKKPWPLAGCYRCGKRGLNIVQLVMDFRALDDPRDACDWITERLENSGNSTVPSPRKGTVPAERKSTVPESEPAEDSSSNARGEAPKPSPQAGHAFDPEEFRKKLDYTHERVVALGLDPDQAYELGIGVNRNKLYQAMRYDNGQIAGFSDGDFNLPKKLIPKSNVLAFNKKAG